MPAETIPACSMRAGKNRWGLLIADKSCHSLYSLSHTIPDYFILKQLSKCKVNVPVQTSFKTISWHFPRTQVHIKAFTQDPRKLHTLSHDGPKNRKPVNWTLTNLLQYVVGVCLRVRKPYVVPKLHNEIRPGVVGLILDDGIFQQLAGIASQILCVRVNLRTSCIYTENAHGIYNVIFSSFFADLLNRFSPTHNSCKPCKNHPLKWPTICKAFMDWAVDMSWICCGKGVQCMNDTSVGRSNP